MIGFFLVIMADARDTRPEFASDHESNRIKVCAPCGKKLTVNQVRKISERENHLIQQFVNSSFDMDNAVYPIVFNLQKQSQCCREFS